MRRKQLSQSPREVRLDVLRVWLRFPLSLMAESSAGGLRGTTPHELELTQQILSAISGLAFPRCSYHVISNNKNASSGWIRLSFPIPVLKQTPTITLVLSCPSPSPGTAQMLISMVIVVIFIILILSINLVFWIKVHWKLTNEFVRFVFEMTIHNVICSTLYFFLWWDTVLLTPVTMHGEFATFQSANSTLKRSLLIL